MRDYRPRPKRMPTLEELTAKEWWRIEELCIHFGVHQATIYRWIVIEQWRRRGAQVCAKDVVDSMWHYQAEEMM